MAAPSLSLQWAREAPNSDPGVRVVAAEMIGVSTDPAATAALIGALQTEQSSPVRRGLIDALIDQPISSEQNTALARAFAADRLPADLRMRLATHLGTKLAEFPENEAVLQNQLKTETQRPVIAAIIDSLRKRPQ
jgi:hypothetical protein